MTDDTCTCADGTDGRTEGNERNEAAERNGGTEGSDSATDRLITDEPVTEAPLPRDVRTALSRFLGGASVETIGDWLAECRRLAEDGGPIRIEDLCHVDEETGHWGEVSGERYDFACFYDAVALSALLEEPVDIRTESPDGTVIEARAVGTDDLTVTPAEAVFSFGIDERAAARGGDDGENAAAASAPGLEPSEPRLEDVYAAVCPYVRAFPDVEAYERWAATVPAATVALPLSGTTEVAAELVD